MKVVNNEGQVVEVSNTAYQILYKERGFTPIDETKTSSSTKKKVKADDKSTTRKSK